MANSTFLSNRVKRILFVVFAFFLYYFVSYIINPFDIYWKNYFQRSVLDLAGDWLVSFVFCWFISEASIFIHNKLNKKLPWTENPTKRFLTETTFNVIAVLLIILINLVFVYALYHDTPSFKTEPSLEDIKGLIQWVVASIIISFGIISINTGSYLIANWKNTEMEVARHKLKEAALRQASIEAELNALKLQLDPHFIFNNLSVLSELILENPKLGYEYSENFAKVYRFLLINSKKNIITLEDELKFLESYMFLIMHRIGEGVNFEVAVDANSKFFYLPPLTLQLLIENSLKHNKTSKNNPLKIKIYSIEENILAVENTLLPIDKKQSYSAGIGLNNIINRFNLLSQKQPEIIVDATSFKVIINLIEYDK